MERSRQQHDCKRARNKDMQSKLFHVPICPANSPESGLLSSCYPVISALRLVATAVSVAIAVVAGLIAVPVGVAVPVSLAVGISIAVAAVLIAAG
jgi:uncharacterized protein (DUF2062 family)